MSRPFVLLFEKLERREHAALRAKIGSYEAVTATLQNYYDFCWCWRMWEQERGAIKPSDYPWVYRELNLLAEMDTEQRKVVVVIGPIIHRHPAVDFGFIPFVIGELKKDPRVTEVQLVDTTGL